MSLKKILMSIWITSAVLAAPAGHAYEYRESMPVHSGSRAVHEGNTAIFDLVGTPFIHKLYIRAEGLSQRDVYAEVSVNGDIKGTLYVPGRDPHYVVTIAEPASSIEITTINGSVRILSIMAIVSDNDDSAWHSIHHPYLSEIGKIARNVIHLVSVLDPLSDHIDFQSCLLPTRKTAAMAAAYADAHGDASGAARPIYEAVVDVLAETCAPYIEANIEIPALQPSIIKLVTEREKLKKLLR